MASRKKVAVEAPEVAEPIRAEAIGELRILHLEGIVGVAQARRLHDVARKLAREGRPVTVRCERLGHLDCAAVQVLLALNETLKEQGADMSMQHMSESLRQTMRIAGLANAF